MTEPVAREPISESIPRKKDGTFAYGAYVGGNKPTGPTLRRKLIEDPRTPLAFDRLLYNATDPEFGAWKPEIQQRAIEYVVDQTIGKAKQDVHIEDDSGPNILQLMAAEYYARARGLPSNSPNLLNPSTDLPSAQIDTHLQDGSAPLARSRGRPKGSTDKTPRKRKQAT